ncbi:DUF2269 family protein [Cohnella sp. REN36]|uniref:DUF2269 family protein n=1 Tax=Cohnella sp. REN36 TaxID=2887347 RepID=UPI001D14E2B6|nr:DUF2269 family protein [Cohnella sp. REN36]MCC3375167.1 DUF2269 domain-containing protein [Cohnella sp. REN36]
MYIYLLFVHLVAAVMGLGAAFGFPIVLKSAKTVSQAKFALALLHKLEMLPKIGSLLLLATGLWLGFLEPYLFEEVWFIGSIVLFLAAMVIVAGILPRKAKKQSELLASAQGEQLPSEYKAIAAQSARLESVTHAIAFILILLMVFKPF